MKVNVSLDDQLLERLDDYADANYMTRSGCITLACTTFLNQNEAVLAMRDISLAFRKIADSGTLDEETMKQLEDIERLTTLFNAKG